MAKFCKAAAIGFLLLTFAGIAADAQPYPYPYWRPGWRYRHRVWAYYGGPYYGGYWGPRGYGYGYGGRGYGGRGYWGRGYVSGLDARSNGGP